MKKIISYLLTFILIFQYDVEAATSMTASPRTLDLGQNVKDSMTPSDLPIAGYSDFFDKENINLVENFDLSQYQSLKPFVGYGVYDVDKSACQYIEVPGKDKTQFDSTFKKYTTYNTHSYGVSMNRMNYTDCDALAKSFGGNVVAIDEQTENSIVSNLAIHNVGDSTWVGANINTCQDSLYTSSILKNQNFYNWTDPSKASYCDLSTKNIVMDTLNGTWDKINNNGLAYCTVEWNSPSYYRPLQICAPWWKILRDYPNSSSSLYNLDELKKINQADISKSLKICTKYSSAAVQQSILQAPTRDVTCTTYYGVQASKPECMRDIKQSQCFIDECGGYIRNACRYKSEDTVGKGYVKGEIINDTGQLVSVKIKDDVKTLSFTCPPSPPSDQFCEEASSVTVFPYECPNSQCDLYKDCINKIPTTIDKTAFDNQYNACGTQYICEKVYPSRDVPPTLDMSGNVVSLTGVCSDGSLVPIPPNIISTQGKKCVKYDEHNESVIIPQQCVQNRTFSDYVVNVALGETDSYQDNPDCIRSDKPEDSQSNTIISMTQTLKDYFKNKIRKVYINGSEDLIYNSVNNGNFLTSILLSDKSQVGTPPQANVSQTNIGSQGSCTPSNIPDLSTYANSPAFYDRSNVVLYDGTSIDSNIQQLDVANEQVVLTGTDVSLTSAMCTSYASDHGFASYQNGSPIYTVDSAKNSVCTIKLNSTSVDSGLDYIKALSPSQVMYSFAGTMTKQNCLFKAVALGGTYNENGFGVDYSSTGKCIVDSGTTPDSYDQYIESISNCPKSNFVLTPPTGCDAGSETNNVAASINGLTSIVVIEDYLDGPFGFYSNWKNTIPQENVVNITTDTISNSQAFPLVQFPTVTDNQNYVATITHWSYLNKTPDATGEAFLWAAAVYASLAVALFAVTVAMMVILPGIGFVVMAIALAYLVLDLVIAALVVAIVGLLTPPKKMDKQSLKWVIYKASPNLFLGMYDLRVRYATDTLIGTATVPGNDSTKIYVDGGYMTGRYKPGTFLNDIKSYKNQKIQILQCAGYSVDNIYNTMHQAEDSIITGYPSCPWYNPWCEKSQTSTWQFARPVNKLVKTVYVGGDNSLSLILPYKGDYIFRAYDQYNNMLGQITITSDQFVSAFSANSLKFAKVLFGAGMNIAPGITNSCSRDNVVEWGGGVSGVYYEDADTGTNKNCSKSNDQYVYDHSMTRIEVQPVTMKDQSFNVILTKPMPFANKVIAAVLDKSQTRKYRCYNAFQDCSDNQFTGVKQ